ncbi:prolyl endopeptidase [Flavobacterium sediminis]|uniref:Prolyl endopeptidase n=1 Tax=Flavobacterium sediminis TaxID=2201181 RepID=A0A2U8QXL4_9FLAO|nr:VOC family protein [Flavobacterium sediminis]AWM14893.1 prolyl endopeptidase [Flavobacterium sediminis]
MILRVARHTDDLEGLIHFYTKILELEIIGDFRNHNHYDGVFLGKKDQNWHLEFTTSKDKTTHHSDEDDLMVFYPTDESTYQSILKNIENQQIKKEKAKNPYWNENGILIRDPDGFGIIVSPLKINKG